MDGVMGMFPLPQQHLCGVGEPNHAVAALAASHFTCCSAPAFIAHTAAKCADPVAIAWLSSIRTMQKARVRH